MIDTILQAARQLPAYTAELLTGPALIYVVLALFVFLVSMFFNGGFARLLRMLTVLGLLITAVVAYVKQIYPLIWLCAAALAVLLVYRLIVRLILSIRERSVNRSIERRALAKAELRRGTKGHGDEVPSAPRSSAPKNPAEEGMSRTQMDDAIRKLSELRDAGVITEEEFAEKKAELYSRIG